MAADSCVHATAATNAATNAALVCGEGAAGWVRVPGLPARFLRADGTLVLTDGWPRGEAA